MANSISLFNSIYNKFMKKFYDNHQHSPNELNLTTKEDYYLDLLFQMTEPTASKFAVMAGISKPAATQILNKFIERGLISKTPSETDRRSYYLKLSPAVNQHFADSYAELDRLYTEYLDFLTPTEMQQLSEILKKIDRNL